MKTHLQAFVHEYMLSDIAHYCLPTLLFAGASRAWALVSGKRLRLEVRDPKSILVIRLDRIGDVILTSPMLRELRRLYPRAYIALVVSSMTRPLVEHCPYVDEVLDLHGGYYSWRTMVAELRTLITFCRKELCHRHWDLTLIPRWDVDLYLATLMCQFAGAIRSVAFSEKSSPAKRKINWGFDALCTDVLPPGPLKHEAERNLDIVRHLGGIVGETRLELWLTPADEADAAKCRSNFGLTALSNVVAFGVGASHGGKRWPPARFADLIDQLQRSIAFTPAIVYGPDEASLAGEVQARTNAKLLLLSRPSIRQTAAFISRCTLFIGNDSGPLHIAVAAGLPVVGIWCHPVDGDPDGENNPDRFGPLTTRCEVVRPARPRAPCETKCTFHEAHCITEVTVAQVADAARRLLAKDRCVPLLARARQSRAH